MNGQEKILQRAERKFENQVLEQVAQKISIDQVEMSTIITSLETSISNVDSLFVKLSDKFIFRKDIKDKLSKIDADMKASAHRL